MEPPTKRRFIIKFSYERDDHEKKKPIVTSYWVDSTSTTNKVSTTIKSQEESVKDVVVDSTSAAAPPPPHHKVSSTTTKPMEHYKRMQCWVIVKRMIEGRDGWALKESLDLKFLKGLEKNKSKVQKAIGLKDIEAMLKSYSTPDEFAKDMRFVFSQGLLYHPRHIVHRIATKFSETFENKWKSLNEEWTIEERKVKRIHKRKREQAVYDNERKCLSFQQKRSQLCATY